MPVKTRDTEDEIDALYKLPLDRFVQARNDLAGTLRSEGRAATALRVRALAKPVVSAWAVNQLYWRARPEFDALVKAGRALRAAQQAALEGRPGDVRGAGKERDAALVAALDRALGFLGESDHAVNPAMRLRVATNLEVLAAHGGALPGNAAGRLVEDLDLPGFEIFRTAVAPPGPEPAPERKPTARVVSFQAIADARRELQEAERLASERHAEIHRRKASLEHAQQALQAARAEAERLRAAWEDAGRHARQVQEAIPRHDREVEEARAAATEADGRVERARAALAALKKPRKRS
jgi:hypothetical protein